MRNALVGLLILLATAEALAAPAIDTATGTFSNGGTINITGTGFGATGPNVVFYDSFEKGTPGSLLSLSAGGADIGRWDVMSGNDGPESRYSNAYARGGSNSMMTDFRTSYGQGPVTFYSNVQNTDLLISFWVNAPNNVPGVNGESPNWKLFWVGDWSDGFPYGSDMSVECTYADCSPSEGISALDDTAAPARYDGFYYDPNFTIGQWRRITVAMKNATSGAYVWQQEVSAGGYQIADSQTNVVTAHSDDPWNMLAVPGFGRGDTQARVYTDDVYIATGVGARARVEIGNASAYTECTNLSIITPTSWSDTSIAATVRAGSFTTGTAYLYVTDASGVTGPAEAITIGSTSSGSAGKTGSGGASLGSGGGSFR